MARVRVVVANGNPLVLEGLSQLLDAQGGIVVVGTAVDAGGVRAVVRETMPQVLVVDVDLPGLRSADLIERLAASNPDLGVVIQSTMAGLEEVPAAVRSGARGGLMWDSSTHDLLAAVTAVAAGGRHFDTFLQNSVLRFNSDRPDE